MIEMGDYLPLRRNKIYDYSFKKYPPLHQMKYTSEFQFDFIIIQNWYIYVFI